MKYEYTVNRREYKFGPGQRFANVESARKYADVVRNKALTNMSLEGFYKAVKFVSQKETEDTVILTIIVWYPVDILDV